MDELEALLQSEGENLDRALRRRHGEFSATSKLFPQYLRERVEAGRASVPGDPDSRFPWLYREGCSWVEERLCRVRLLQHEEKQAEGAIEAIARQYRPPLEPGDLVSEAWIRICRVPTAQLPGDPVHARNYLLRNVRHRAIDLSRAR